VVSLASEKTTLLTRSVQHRIIVTGNVVQNASVSNNKDFIMIVHWYRIGVVLLAISLFSPLLSAQAPIAPWDVYLACKGVASLDSARIETDAEVSRLKEFCALDLPRIGNRYASSELSRWRTSLSALPSDVIISELRLHGEEVIASLLQSVNQIQVGGGFNLQFDYGQVVLTTRQRATLDSLAESIKVTLQLSPNQIIDIVGYADSPNRTADPTNLAFANGRAEAITSYLVSRGIDRARLAPRGEVIRVPSRATNSQEDARRVTLGTPGTSILPLQRTSGTATPAVELGVSALVLGTTDFLLERAREQVEHYLLQAGSSRICASETWEQYLRATCGLMPDVDKESGADKGARTYWPSIDIIRAAIRDDLSELPFMLGQAHLRSYVQDSSKPTENREVALFGLAMLPYLREVAAGTPPLEAFAPRIEAFSQQRFPVFDAATSGDRLDNVPEVVQYLRQAQTLVGTVRSAAEDLAPYWDSQQLVDSVALYAVKTLILNVERGVQTEVFRDYRRSWTTHLDMFVTGAREAQRLAALVDSSWVRIRTIAADSAAATRQLALLSNLLSDAAEIAFVISNTGIGDELQEWRSATAPMLELVSNVRGQNYAGALNATLRIAATSTAGQRFDTDQLRLLAFTNDIAQARNSEDVRSAFQRFVGEGPGYQAKRRSDGQYWRLNAYVGLSAGPELLMDAPEGTEDLGLSFGLAVPIGVEFGKGTSEGRSWGGFLQLLDLGAIASARIAGGDGVETFPDFEFGSIVAPGIFGTMGWADAPLTTGLGISYVPLARRSADDDEIGAVKATLFIAVDIPLFP
jgi:outer membrane protein OmpA-like peptidoglycan-associated protein